MKLNLPKLILLGGAGYVGYQLLKPKRSSASSAPAQSASLELFEPSKENVAWNPDVKRKAQGIALLLYTQAKNKDGFAPTPSAMFDVNKRTLQAIWPELAWPENAEIATQTVQVDKNQTPQLAWILYANNLGQPGYAMGIVWDKNMTEVVWPLFGYNPS